MKRQIFKIGDRVKTNGVVDHKTLDGLTGKIVTIIGSSDSPVSLGVEFDTYINGHNCGCRGKMGYCWNVGLGNLSLLTDISDTDNEFDEAESLQLTSFLKRYY